MPIQKTEPEHPALKIDDTAIKLAFYQVEPGKEVDVHDAIKARCDHLKQKNAEMESHICYSLGPYDIVHLYTADGFDPILTQTGTIEGVKKVTRFYCYLFGKMAKGVFANMSANQVVGVKLLKLKSSTYNKLQKVYWKLAGLNVKGDSRSVHVLGTIGWNDLVVLYIDNNVNRIIDELINDDIIEMPFKKTFSLLGLSGTLTRDNRKETGTIDGCSLHFDICSYQPIDMKKMHPIKVDPVSSMLGKYDYCGVFESGQEKLKWGELLWKVIDCRVSNSKWLVSTNLRIVKPCNEERVQENQDIISSEDIISINNFARLLDHLLKKRVVIDSQIRNSLEELSCHCTKAIIEKSTLEDLKLHITAAFSRILDNINLKDLVNVLGEKGYYEVIAPFCPCDLRESMLATDGTVVEPLPVEDFVSGLNQLLNKRVVPDGTIQTTLEKLSRHLNSTLIGKGAAGKSDLEVLKQHIALILSKIVKNTKTRDLVNILGESRYVDVNFAFCTTGQSMSWPSDDINQGANRNVIELLFQRAVRRTEYINYYDYKSYKKLLKDEYAALRLSTHINSFNALLRNKIVSDSFRDMGRYITYINRKISADNWDKAEHKLRFALKASDNLRSGAELRLNGTLGTIEDTVGHFSKIKGGVQRSIHAMEFVISCILSRITKMVWEGYVTVSSSNQFNLDEEVINVPLDAFWNPKKWAPLYHEIGHLVIGSVRPLFLKSETTEQMCVSHPSINAHIVEQVTADIIGYLISCFNYEEFKQNFLDGYVHIFNYLKTNEEVVFTLIRPLVVQLFDQIRHGEKYDSNGRKEAERIFHLTKEYLDALKREYEGTPIADELNRRTKTEMERNANTFFLASHYVDFICGLIPYLQDLVIILGRMGLFYNDYIKISEINVEKLYTFVGVDRSVLSERLDELLKGHLDITLKCLSEEFSGQPKELENRSKAQKEANWRLKRAFEDIFDKSKANTVRNISTEPACHLLNAVEDAGFGDHFRVMFCLPRCEPCTDSHYYVYLRDKIDKGIIVDDGSSINHPEELLKPFLNPDDQSYRFAPSIALINTFCLQNKKVLEQGGV